MRDEPITTLSHADAQAALSAAALGSLEPAEQRALEAHLTTCPECRADRAALLDVVASLALTVPEPPDGAERLARIRGRLLRRVAEDRPARHDRSAGPARSAAAAPAGAAADALVRPAGGMPAWMRLAAAVALLVAAAAVFRLARSRTALGTELAATRAAAALHVDALRDSLASRDRLIAGLTGRRVTVFELTADAARAPNARMFWDRATDRWTLVAHDLPPAGAGRTYQLWLITGAGERISAGTFDPGADGDAMMQAEYPMEQGALQLVAVTLEPAGGMPQPTGPIVIAGGAAAN